MRSGFRTHRNQPLGTTPVEMSEGVVDGPTGEMSPQTESRSVSIRSSGVVVLGDGVYTGQNHWLADEMPSEMLVSRSRQ
jgi:hypothetical protein